MSSKEAQIKINVKADTTGATQAAAAIQKDKQAVEELNAASNKKTALNESLKETSTAATQAKADVEAFNAALKDQAASAQTVSEKTDQASAKTKSYGGIISNAGNQIQDIAVQAQSGTSWLTIIAQQVPQLLGAFGPAGAIAGGIVALGAIAAKVFIGMLPDAEAAAKAAEAMGEKLREAFNDDAQRKADAFRAKIELQAEASDRVRLAEIELAEARRKRADIDAQLIESNAQLEEAAIRYLEKTGQITDAEQRLEASRDAAREKRKNAEIEEANARLALEQKKFEAAVQAVEDERAKEDQARQRITVLEREQKRRNIELQSTKRVDEYLVSTGREDKGYVSETQKAAQAAADAVAKQIEGAYEIIRAIPERVAQLQEQAAAQSDAINVAFVETQAKIAEVNAKYDIETTRGNITAATEAVGKTIETLASGIEGITVQTQVQVDAKQRIEDALADGKLTASEAQQTVADLRVLLTNLRADQQSQRGAITELLQVMNESAAWQQRIASDIQALKVKTANVRTIK